MNIDYSKYENFFPENNEYENLNVSLIENTYKEELEKEIKKDIESLGFNIKHILFNLDMETGKLTNLNIRVDNSKKSNTISVNKIEVGNSKKEENYILSKGEEDSIRKNLREKYSLEDSEITINST